MQKLVNFIQIDMELFSIKELTKSDILIYSYILGFTRKYNYIVRSSLNIADCLYIDKRTVNRSLNKLKKYGLIGYVKYDKRPNAYVYRAIALKSSKLYKERYASETIETETDKVINDFKNKFKKR